MVVISNINPDVGPLPTKGPELGKTIHQLFSLKGKVASITGSSAGIGWGVAEAYAQSGADVAIWYNNRPAEDKAEYLSKTYGVKAKAYKCEISDYEEVTKTINQIEKDFGGLDIFVANAAISWQCGKILEVEGLGDWDKIIGVDFSSVYYCAKAAGAIFKKNGKGSFIITSSISAHIVNVPQSHAPYNAIKAGLNHLARSLAVEWAPFARVNTVSPGTINTTMADFNPQSNKDKWHSLTPLGREGEVQELVGAFVYFASDASSYTTGSDLLVDGGYCCP